MTAVQERPGVVPAALPRGPLTGAGVLVRLILRRDRIAITAWVVIMAVLPVLLAIATEKGYPAEADRLAFAAASAANPAELALRGPVFAPSVGALAAWTFGSSGVLVGGIVSVLLLIRHTRGDEQAGRRELVGAGVVGRHAPLAAALAVVVAGNVVIAVLAALGLLAHGLPVAGSIALGSAIGAGAIVFTAVAAVAAQLVEGTGGARGVAFVVFGVAFLLAAIGDGTGSGLVWASPFGWVRHIQAFAAERWWVLGPLLGTAAVLAALAFALSARRDVGGGLFAARPGPAHAGAALRSPLALAWRLHRASVLSWAAGLTMLGLMLGFAMGSLGNQLDTPAFRALAVTLGGGDVAAVFFRFVLYVLAQVVAAATIAAALRMRSQETGGLADAVLVLPVGRVRWALGHLVITAGGAALTLLGLGLGAGIGYGAPFAVLGSTVAYLPACLVFAGLAVVLVGWAPRVAVPVTWVLLALALIVDLLGEFKLVGAAVLQVSPFVRTLQSLGSGAVGPALVLLTVVAVVLGAVGLAGLRRRDVDAA
ncbi:ABC transporter permease [Pseudonocardia sp. GCM10023141]|uniref:ABC transporter permease n=1 Tax=Pseudonocardia sp. GCM10023141 TaxID=3252653 RepID=UPI00360BBCD0